MYVQIQHVFCVYKQSTRKILHPNDKTSMEAACSELLLRAMFFLMMLEIQTQNLCGVFVKDTQMLISTCDGIITSSIRVTQITGLSVCLLEAAIRQIKSS